MIANIKDLGVRLAIEFNRMQILPGAERHGAAEHDQDG